MLCYGYVALYAPASLIVSRLETTILKAINPHFNHVKVRPYSSIQNDRTITSQTIRAITLIIVQLHCGLYLVVIKLLLYSFVDFTNKYQ